MDRVIKFRMWNPDAKKYHYDVENVFQCIAQQNIHDGTMGSRGFTLGYDHIGEGAVFEQFTGLLDKNGKEVYEGDIVRQYFYNSSHLTKSKLFDVPVIYQENEFTFDASIPNSEKFRTYTLFDFCVVVGNIHEESDINSIEGKETKGNG